MTGSVLAFTAAASVVAAVVFGMLPALRGTRKVTATTTTRGGGRLSNLLVAAEIALSFVLLAGAGLMVNSLWRLLHVNPGFETANLLTMDVSLPASKYPDDEARLQYYETALGRIRGVAGVRATAAVATLPMTRDPGPTNSFQIEAGARFALVPFQVVSAGYFTTMRIPLVKGRLFMDGDRAGSPGVAVINQAMVRRFWRDADPIGAILAVPRLKFERTGGESRLVATRPRVQIVGVVGDTLQVGLDTDPRPTLYLPYTQRPPAEMAMIARGTQPFSRPLVGQVSNAVSAIDPDLPIVAVKTMDQLMADDTAGRRFVLVLLGVFALVAAGLAVVGIYGVVSHAVARRTREIAVRLALGARPGAVVRLLARQQMMWVLAGVAAGIACAVALMRLLANQLYGVTPTDIPTFAAAGLLLAAVAVLADVVPAWRATRVMPAEALRNE